MNSALTLLLRYPPLDNSLRARTLVRDARTIIQSPTLETGASLIIKYSGRPPAAIETLDLRSHTPSYGTPTRIRSPLAMASSPASLESLLADAAKGVMSRGERWGLNQAVRDVVGEVKRGVERGIQNAPDPSAWSRSASPRGFHQRTRSTKPTSESHGMITANVLRKMNALEDRNRKLAEMLDSAVKDLWNCHEKLAEKAKAEGTVDGEDGKFAEKLSKSVAEVQFVQAFLRDMTLPLPEPLEEVSRDDDTQQRPSSPTPTGSGDQSPKARENSKLATNSQPIQTPNVVADYHPTVISKPQRMPLDHEAGNASACIRSQASPESQPVLSGSVPTQRTPGLLSTGFAASSMPPPIPPTSITDPFLARPRLTSSSFSWMLADNNAEGQPFARATPFAPNEKRTHAKTGKGFLFGEDEDDRSTASGRSTKAPAGRKGSKSKVKSTSAAIREREAIGLGDVTVEDGKFDKEGGSGPPPL
jgi:TBC1 domain family protein 5